MLELMYEEIKAQYDHFIDELYTKFQQWGWSKEEAIAWVYQNESNKMAIDLLSHYELNDSIKD